MMRTEYKMKTWQQVFYGLLGVLILASAGFFAFVFASEKNAAMFFLFAFFIALLGVYMLALTMRSRIVLEGSLMEVRGAFREKAADLGEMEGYRTITTRNGSFQRIYLKEGRGSLSIASYFASDDVYREWFKKIPNLDERDRDELLRQIAGDESLGDTQEARLASLAGAKRIAIGLTVASIVAAIILHFGGLELRQPSAIVLAIVPLVAAVLAWRRPQLYAVSKSKADPRAEVGLVWLAAGIGFLLSTFDMHLVSALQILPATAAVFAVVLLALLPPIMRRPNKRQALFVSIFFGFLFSYGVTLAANHLGDHSSPTTYGATVQNKHISSGRSKTNYLDLAPWGPFPDGNSMSVSSSTYAEFAPGDQICLGVYAGALHVEWYAPVTCPSGPGLIQESIPGETK
jgi:hypothetical protein